MNDQQEVIELLPKAVSKALQDFVTKANFIHHQQFTVKSLSFHRENGGSFAEFVFLFLDSKQSKTSCMTGSL